MRLYTRISSSACPCVRRALVGELAYSVMMEADEPQGPQAELTSRRPGRAEAVAPVQRPTGSRPRESHCFGLSLMAGETWVPVQRQSQAGGMFSYSGRVGAAKHCADTLTRHTLQRREGSSSSVKTQGTTRKRLCVCSRVCGIYTRW